MAFRTQTVSGVLRNRRLYITSLQPDAFNCYYHLLCCVYSVLSSLSDMESGMHSASTGSSADSGNSSEQEPLLRS